MRQQTPRRLRTGRSNQISERPYTPRACQNQLSSICKKASHFHMSMGQDRPCDTSFDSSSEDKGTASLVQFGIKVRLVWMTAKAKRSGVTP